MMKTVSRLDKRGPNCRIMEAEGSLAGRLPDSIAKRMVVRAVATGKTGVMGTVKSVCPEREANAVFVEYTE